MRVYGVSNEAKKGLYLILFTAISIVVLIAGYFTYDHQLDQLYAERYSDLSVIGQLKVDQLTQWRSERLGDARLTAESPLFRDAVLNWIQNPRNIVDRDELLARLKLVQESYHYEDALILTPDGRVLLSAMDDPDPVDAETIKSMAVAIETGSPVISQLYTCPHNTVHADVLAPIVNEANQAVAVVLLHSNAEQFLYPLIQSWPTASKTAESLLIRRDGDDVLFLNGLRHQPEAGLMLRIPTTQTTLPAVAAVEGHEGMFIGEDYRGEEVLTDLRGIPGSDWFIVSKWDTAEIRAEVGDRVLLQAVVMLLLIVITGAGFLVIYRQRQASVYQKLLVAERSNAEALSKFEATLTSIGDGVVVTDATGAVTFLNPVAEQLTGYELSEASGRGMGEVLQIISEVTGEPVENPAEIVLREGRVVGLANHSLLVSKDGREIPIADSGAPVRSSEGDVVGVVMVFRDQSESRAAEQALAESERRFRTLFETAPVGIFETDSAGGVRSVNREMASILGFTSVEEVYDYYSDLGKQLYVTEGRRTEFIDILKEYGSVVDFEYEAIKPDGTQAWLSMNARMSEKNEDGTFSIQGFTTDITSRIMMRNALFESEALLRNVLNTIPDLVWLKGKDGVYLACNPTFERFFGATESEIKGKTDYDFVDKELADFFRENDNNAIAAGGPTMNEETLTFSDTGESYLFETVKTPMTNRNGDVLGVLGIARNVSERQQAIDALRASENRLHRAFENVPDVLVIYGPDLRIRYINESTRRVTGRATEEFIGKRDEELWPPEVYQEYVPTLKNALASRKKLTIESELEIPGEGVRYLRVTVIPLLDDDGKVIELLGITHDMTESRKSQQALRESEEIYRSLMDAAPIGVAVHSEGKVVFVNKAGLKIMRAETEDEIVGKSITEIVYPTHLDAALDRVQRMMKGEEGLYPVEDRYRRMDGSPVQVEVMASRLTYKGKPAIQVIVSDITARKAAEAERELLVTAINQSAESIVITDVQARIQYVNPTFEEHTGYTREEVIGKNPSILKSGKQDLAFYQELWATIRSGKTWIGRMVNKRKNGELYTEEASISPVFDHDGNIVNFVAAKRDITKEISLEQQFRQAQKMESVGRLAGGVAHDFNNMLSVILGTVELAQLDLDPDHSVYNDLVEIEEAARRSSELTRQLLAFARKQTVDPKVLDLNQSVEGMLKMLQRLMGEDINLSWKPADNLAPVLLDPAQLDQVLANMCVNARDAIAGVGKVDIQTQAVDFDEEYCLQKAGFKPGRYVMLTVSDNGSGMEQEVAEQIFEPFFTTKAKGKGTGLGLSTVYGIIKQNNGFIDVYSELDVGTTFKMYFPEYQGETEDISEDILESVPHGNGEVVLVVEDEKTLLTITKRMLTGLNYVVITETSATRALETLRASGEMLDLLLADVVMPEMNGRELVEQIRGQFPQVKSLYMSGYTADVIANQGVLEKGVNFISKPFTLQNLAKAVRKALES
ncbi:PAS domain S-box protein [bacterium]|nr:PAS domain S-box protein [bacterium]